MKSNRRRLPVPQHEFGFVPATFNLMVDTGLDGERITHERAEAAQTVLFTTTRNDQPRP